MDIKNIVFEKSASCVNQIEQTLPQICVVGRSNVGKSSFINMLARNKKLAKTSQTPGRTRLINVFNVDKTFRLVDLPGYGYAKATTVEINKWAEMINEYITSERVNSAILLLDIRHKPTEKDKQMLEFLYSFNFKTIIVATKLDKIKKSEIAGSILKIAQTLKIAQNNIIKTSAETGQGRQEVIDKIYQILNLGENNENLGVK